MQVTAVVRLARAFALTLAAAVAAGAVTATVASAAVTPSSSASGPDPIVIYEGGMTMNSSDGFTENITARMTVDCSEDPCTAIIETTSGRFVASVSNGQTLSLTNGALTADLPKFGSICDLRFVGPGTLDVSITGDSAAVSRTSGAVTNEDCGDGATGEASSAVISGTLAVVQGTSCLAAGSCSLAPSPSPTPTTTPTPTPTTSATAGGGFLDDLPKPIEEQPSVLRTLPTFEAIYTPEAITVASAGAVILALLVAFPSALLDSASERVAEWADERRARKGKGPRDPAARPPLTLVGWPAATVGLLVAAAASAYVEPDFGPTVLGVQTAIGILVSFIVVVAFGWAFVSAAMWLGHRRELPRIEFRPLTLLVVGAAVVFSRLSGFEPGVIFGLIAGVGFGAAVSQVTQARAAVLTLVYTMAAAGTGWFLYSTAANFWGDDLNWPQAIAMESLAAITIAGLAALPIALLPMRGLTGHAVWAWNRWAWGVAYSLSLAAFFWVLMPLPDSWQAVDLPLKAWMLTYAAYGVVSLLAWLVIRQPWRRPKDEKPEPEPEPEPEAQAESTPEEQPGAESESTSAPAPAPASPKKAAPAKKKLATKKPAAKKKPVTKTKATPPADA